MAQSFKAIGDASNCHVYVVAHQRPDGRSEKPVKIGITANLDSRLSSLSTGNPVKLCYAMTLSMPRAAAQLVEKSFHDLQVDRRLSGEWFDIEVSEAMQLLCFYFDAALRMTLEADEIIDEIREASGLNLYRDVFRRTGKWGTITCQ